MEIPENAYRDIARYYEKHEAEILELDFDEYFELLVAYTDALFEIGAYRRHQLMADVVIETVIELNITDYQGRDIFHGMLFRKAASCYNTFQTDKAEHILKELLKMDPTHKDHLFFFKKCRSRQYPDILSGFQAAGIFCFLLCAFLIGIEVLLVRPFYEMHTLLIVYSRNTIFLFGCLSVAAGYSYTQWLARRDTRRFLDSIRKG